MIARTVEHSSQKPGGVQLWKETSILKHPVATLCQDPAVVLEISPLDFLQNLRVDTLWMSMEPVARDVSTGILPGIANW